MGNALLLLGEIVLLYFFSVALTQHLYLVFFLMFRSRHVATSLITGLLFPGTVIHELSHLFTAEILGVHTGRLTLTPEAIEEKEVKTGSVVIAQTGPFRRAAIGLAPMVVGSISLIGLIGLMSKDNTNLTVLYYYLMFTISNTMFSSREDMKGFVPLAIAVSLIFATAWYTGFRLALTGPAQEVFNKIVAALVQSIGLVLAINLVLLLISQLLVILATKITHQRLHR